MVIGQAKNKLALMVPLALGEAKGLSCTARVRMSERVVSSLNIGSVDFAAYGGRTEDPIYFFRVSEDDFPVNLDHSILLVLLDYLNIAQVVRWYKPRLRGSTWSRLSRWLDKFAVDLKQRILVLVQLIGREKIRHTYSDSFDLFEEAHSVRACAFADHLGKDHLIDGIKCDPDPGIAQFAL